MKKKAKRSEVGTKKPYFNYGAMYTLGGGPACCHGEGETGTGGDESQAVVNSALTGWEGRSPDRPACWEEEAPGGGPGNEVRQQKTYVLLPLFMITRKADVHGQTHPIPNWKTHLSKHIHSCNNISAHCLDRFNPNTNVCVPLGAIKSQKSECSRHLDVSQTFLWSSRLLLQQKNAKTFISCFRNISAWTCWTDHLDMVYVDVMNL